MQHNANQRKYPRISRFQRLEPRKLLAAEPVISELMASNNQSLDDGNGRSSDWIEIYNAGDETANLAGWYLTDDLKNLSRWKFPEVQIEPDQYLVLFASGINIPNYVDQDEFLHTNFKLSSGGESLALVDADLTIVHTIEFPKQHTDISYGFAMPQREQFGFFPSATPGTPNGRVLSGVTASHVTMSQESGVFTESIMIELTTDALDSTILLTVDGTIPNEASSKYTRPFEISKSTQIRARVMEADRVLGPVTTASFLKLDNEASEFTSQIPIMVIDNLGAGDIPNTDWNQTNSRIEQLPRQAANWMLFETDDAGSRFTAKADVASRIGIRVRGAFSSTFREPGYSLETWSDSADSDVDISPLGIAADSDWVLYAPNPQYDETLIDNSFLFAISNQMDSWAPEVRYVEAFVNTDGGDITMDDHVGMYVITEKVKRTADRIDFEEFAVDGSSGGWILDINRLDPIALDGSRPKNFHTAGPDGILQTDRDLWRTSSRGDDIPRQYNAYINYDDPSGLSINPAQRDAISAWFDEMEDVLYGRVEGVTWNDPIHGYAKYIDVDNFIDYFILNDISHNGDGLLISLWVYNSDPNGDGKLQIGPIWDADLGSFSGSAATELMRRKDRLWYGRMFEDPHFVLRFTERWQEHRRTVLSDDNMSNVIDRFYSQIGDETAARDRVRNWRNRLDRMQSWLADRANAIDQLFVPPPELNHPGGVVSNGFELTILSNRGDAYYTLDGTDPRADDGTVSPQAQRTETEFVLLVPTSAAATAIVPDTVVDELIGSSWTAGEFVEGAAGETWIEGITGIGFDNRGVLDELIETDLGESDNLSVYVRIPFEITADQFSNVKDVVLRMQYDDGFVAYMNGTEVARSNVPGVIGEPVPIDVRAERSHRARPGEFDAFPLEKASLQMGTNYLAIQGLNRSRSGGDLLIRPELVGVTVVSPPILIREPTNVFARTKDGDDWSGPTTAEFTVRPGILGDLNGDGQITSADIDRLCAAIHEGDREFDFTQDEKLDELDLENLVQEQLSTNFGDANVDGKFDSGDLVAVFIAGQYDDDIAGNSTWSTGDWNCDGEFDSSDLVVAFQQGGFVAE